MTKSRREIEALIEVLDDAPIEEGEAKETVAKLGVDLKSLAAGLRARVTAADARDTKTRIADARRAYAAEVEKLALRKRETNVERDAMLATFKNLLAKAPSQAAVGMHFHKYESASDEELAELIRALRHLLGEDDSE